VKAAIGPSGGALGDMPANVKKILSASRRTDIPAFYLDWFMNQIQRGRFEVVNPYNQRVKVVAATPVQVDTIVFWSKNFGPFLRGRHGERLLQMGYHLFFNFTINSTAPLLEPRLPPLEARLEQLARLCRRFDPRWIHWRFDPICVYRTADGCRWDNLGDFDRIARVAAQLGIRRCITSFMDHYAKIQRRTRAMDGFAFIDPPVTEKVRTLRRLEKVLQPLDISLQTCCEGALLPQLPDSSTIGGSACIPGRFLRELFGGQLAVRRDSGQRVRAGCNCSVAVDIGDYHRHPCPHGCLFCYANPLRPGPGRPVHRELEPAMTPRGTS
jgi:hypothetical protein